MNLGQQPQTVVGQTDTWGRLPYRESIDREWAFHPLRFLRKGWVDTPNEPHGCHMGQCLA